MVPAAFAVLILLGALLLSLPISSESGEWTNGWDALFTATSAICVTGLVRFDTADHFSFFGELVVVVLIQLGGLGVTMYAGMLILFVGGQFGLRGRDFFGIELIGDSERDVRRLLRRAALFIFTLEAATFLLLLPWSLTKWDPAPGGLAGLLPRAVRLQLRGLRSDGRRPAGSAGRSTSPTRFS